MPLTNEENKEYFDTAYESRVIGNQRELNWIHRRHVHIAKRLVGTVLDLGCGLGLLADRTEEQYLGIDFSEVAIAYARANTENPKAEFMIGELFEFVASVADNAWQTVVLGEVLEHFQPDPRGALLAEAKRIAANRVVLSVPENSPDPSHVQHKWNMAQVKALVGPAEIAHTRGHYYAVWAKDGRAAQIAEIVEKAKKNCAKCTQKD